MTVRNDINTNRSKKYTCLWRLHTHTFAPEYTTQDYLLQGTRRFGELGGKQWKANPTRGSIYPILFSTYVHFRKFNISHIQSLEDEAPACTISLS